MKLLEKVKELLDERAKSLRVMLESEREKNQDLVRVLLLSVTVIWLLKYFVKLVKLNLVQLLTKVRLGVKEVEPTSAHFVELLSTDTTNYFYGPRKYFYSQPWIIFILLCSALGNMQNN